jgi:hypothetical protein
MACILLYDVYSTVWRVFYCMACIHKFHCMPQINIKNSRTKTNNKMEKLK